MGYECDMGWAGKNRGLFKEISKQRTTKRHIQMLCVSVKSILKGKENSNVSKGQYSQ